MSMCTFTWVPLHLRFVGLQEDAHPNMLVLYAVRALLYFRRDAAGSAGRVASNPALYLQLKSHASPLSANYFVSPRSQLHLSRITVTMAFSFRTRSAASGSELRPIGVDDTTAVMLQCLFAMIFGAVVLSLLTSSGIACRSSPCKDMGNDGYNFCGAWQDIRTVLSFSLGALMCHLMHQVEGSAPQHDDSCRKGGLHACLLW
ncbi:unnamed protein product [Polarella glacialis]|uniref:Uncharacterized protein n=1 Tax=Polarella glacialis TaxID=89957 RepID=A0A813K3P3_POLGL|nr:unnamed protein product [Polarella glacialis]CAE8691773.1 unnamed protein product [Polarella glacialis]